MAQQLELPDMPKPQFDSLAYSVDEITKAQAKVAETHALLDKHPDLLAKARSLALARAAESGRVGVRWLGEVLRVWLADSCGDGLSNNSVGVIARLLIREEPWFANLLDTRPCALDVVMGGEAS